MKNNYTFWQAFKCKNGWNNPHKPVILWLLFMQGTSLNKTKVSFQTGTCKEVPGTHRDMNISTGYYYDNMSGLLQNNKQQQ